jgi:putative addiction module component (TIGR02574 family)
MDTQIPDSVPLNQLLALSGAQKVALISALWDSMDERDVPIPDWQLEELERRQAAVQEGAEPLVAWEDIKQRILGGHDQQRSP